MQFFFGCVKEFGRNGDHVVVFKYGIINIQSHLCRLIDIFEFKRFSLPVGGRQTGNLRLFFQYFTF